MLLGILVASLLGDMLIGKGILRTGYGNKEGKEFLRAGYECSIKKRLILKCSTIIRMNKGLMKFILAIIYLKQ